MTINCGKCGRDPRKINSRTSECSVLDCPYRRTQWSEGRSAVIEASMEMPTTHYPRHTKERETTIPVDEEFK